MFIVVEYNTKLSWALAPESERFDDNELAKCLKQFRHETK